MKKTVAFMAVMAFVSIMVGCGKEGETSTLKNNVGDSLSGSNLEENVSDIVEIGKAQFVQIGGRGELFKELEFENGDKFALSSVRHIGIRRVTDIDELSEVLGIIEDSEYMSLNLDDNNSLERVMSEYDEDYFKQNNLLVTSLQSPQLEYSYAVESVRLEKDCLKVCIKETAPEMGSYAMADWIGVIEVSKGYFSDETKLDAVVE